MFLIKKIVIKRKFKYHYLYIYYINGKCDRFLVDESGKNVLFDAIANIMLGW